MTTPVTDDVWRALNPHAGRMPRRTAVICAAAVAALLATVLIVVGGWRSGVLAPNLGLDPSRGWGYDVDPGHRTFGITFAVRNNGLIPVDIAGFGRGGRGLKLTGARGPSILEPGDGADFYLAYEVTDCAAIPLGDWPVPFRIKRGFGEQTAYVFPPEETSPDAPDSYSYSGDQNPYAIAWQELIAGKACGRYVE